MDLLQKYFTQFVLLVIFLVLSPWLGGINHAGQRTLIQYPNGTLVVKFEPGIFLQLFEFFLEAANAAPEIPRVAVTAKRIKVFFMFFFLF